MLRVKEVAKSKEKVKPVLLKIAPDLTDEQLTDVIDILKITGTDGVIATNTTISRDGLVTAADEVDRIGTGGLSGAPLRARATEVIRRLRTMMGPDYPIIGIGGIMSPDDAIEKLKAGANLVQVYTGFIYENPGFIKRINHALRILKP